MRILLDTHVFLWWIDNDPNLSSTAADIIRSRGNELYFSAASGWEIAIKMAIGKLKLPGNLEEFVTEQLALNNIKVIPIQLVHTLGVYRLPLLHRDPFDRLLVAQSQLEQMPLLTADPLITQYSVQTLW
jgi:PIN domain nuclease of toxin-antitoxin system